VPATLDFLHPVADAAHDIAGPVGCSWGVGVGSRRSRREHEVPQAG
jgi:hypothetical protein